MSNVDNMINIRFEATEFFRKKKAFMILKIEELVT
jgi:hypothetical protein